MTKVLYIAGFGRSGSTLLGNILGSAEGCFSTGELHMLWQALIRGTGCGCGRRVEDCPVWSAVLQELRAAGWRQGYEEVRSWQLGVARIAHTPRLIRMNAAPADDSPLGRYSALLGDLYRAIARVTGAGVIVDSSKTPADAAIARHIEGVDIAVIHLVRDPRAVAASQRRSAPTLDVHRSDQMHRRNIAASSLRWLVTNELTSRLVSSMGKEQATTIRYEDFVERPREVALQALSLVGNPPDRLPFVDERIASIAPNHTVWGNRSRFTTGDVPLRADDAWRREQGAWSFVVTALTFPRLGRYGYPLSPRSPATFREPRIAH
jgi:hypothetical protein